MHSPHCWLFVLSCSGCLACAHEAPKPERATNAQGGEARAPTALPAQRVEPAEPAPAPRETPDPNETSHLLVQLRSENGAFSVVRVTSVKAPLPRHRGKVRAGGWRFETYAGTDAAIYTDQIAPPHTVRGEFLGGGGQHVVVERPEPVDFVVRVPVGTEEVRFFDASTQDLALAPRALGSVLLPKAAEAK